MNLYLFSEVGRCSGVVFPRGKMIWKMACCIFPGGIHHASPNEMFTYNSLVCKTLKEVHLLNVTVFCVAVTFFCTYVCTCERFYFAFHFIMNATWNESLPRALFVQVQSIRMNDNSNFFSSFIIYVKVAVTVCASKII